MFKRVLASLLISVMLITPAQVLAADDTIITGTNEVSQIKTSFTATATYTINPNDANGTYFTADEITVQNTGTTPINIGIKSVSSSNTMEDVLPTQFSDWYNLGTADSEKYIALGLKSKADNVWRAQTRTTDLYIVEAKTATEENPIMLGALDGESTITYELIASHGLSFSQVINNTHTINWCYELTEE